ATRASRWIRDAGTLTDTSIDLRLVESVFFFQAEDGIRDGHVTGVQTCALPIFHQVFRFRHDHMRGVGAGAVDADDAAARDAVIRSEERRVGKECRSRWSRYH